MGHIVKNNDHFEYRQEDGKTTAWFTHLEIKKELVHKGDLKHKKILFLLISTGLLYLISVFTFVH